MIHLSNVCVFRILMDYNYSKNNAHHHHHYYHWRDWRRLG